METEKLEMTPENEEERAKVLAELSDVARDKEVNVEKRDELVVKLKKLGLRDMNEINIELEKLASKRSYKELSEGGIPKE